MQIFHKVMQMNNFIRFRGWVPLFVMIVLFVPGSSAQSTADISVTIIPNQFYFESLDNFGIDLRIANNGPGRMVDLYWAVEVYGEFYFYPGFSRNLDHHQIYISPESVTHETIIPLVSLPENLPFVHAVSYAVCTNPGTFDLISNVDIRDLFLQDTWPELPVPDIENTFFFLPGTRQFGATHHQSYFDEFADLLNAHFPITGPYMRMGVSLKDPVTRVTDVSPILEVAQRAHTANLALGIHVDTAPHHLSGDLETLRQSDRRYNQWESDGTFYSTGQDDLTCITPSRYADELMETRQTLAGITGVGFEAAREMFPNTLVYINGPIEVEFRRAEDNDHHYADYSPFAITEFRDWLCHRGRYNDGTGTFSGDGIPLSLIHEKDFSRDPSPNEHFGVGVNFNEYFETEFTTWNILYWDPDIYPQALAIDSNPRPGPGESGYIDGGFHPPREVDGELVGGNSRFHAVWDGFYNDQGLGFRQMQIYYYVRDHAQWISETGVPIEYIFTHQIPSDFLNNWIRLRSSASPAWTAENQYSQCGYTAYWDTAMSAPFFQVAENLPPGGVYLNITRIPILITVWDISPGPLIWFMNIAHSIFALYICTPIPKASMQS